MNATPVLEGRPFFVIHFDVDTLFFKFRRSTFMSSRSRYSGCRKIVLTTFSYFSWKP